MRTNRRITGILTAILLSLALMLPAGAAIDAYELETDDLVQRVRDTVQYGRITYTSFYNINEVSRASLREAAAAARRAGGKVFINFDTLAGDEVAARITINPMLVKSGEGSFSFIVDTATETNAEAKAKFESLLDRPVAVMKCEQSGDFGMPVVLSGKLDLAGMNKENLIAYAYDPEKNDYSVIRDARCTTDENGFVYLQTRQGGTIVITSIC